MRQAHTLAAALVSGLTLSACVSTAPVSSVQMAPAGTANRDACARAQEEGRQIITCLYPEFTFSAAGDGVRNAALTNVVAEYAIYDGDGQAEVTIRGGGVGVTHALSRLFFNVSASDAGGGRRQVLTLDPAAPVTITCDRLGRSQAFEVKGFVSAALVTSLTPLPLSITSPMLRCPGS